MNPPLASLYDISLGIHQLSGLVLIIVAVAVTVFSVLARNNVEMLEKAMPLTKLAGPFFGLILLTGIYQLANHHIKFFQAWVIGGLLLGIAFMGTLHGTWRPRARLLLEGKVEGEDAIAKAKSTLIGVSASLIVMVAVATALMESHS